MSDAEKDAVHIVADPLCDLHQEWPTKPDNAARCAECREKASAPTAEKDTAPVEWIVALQMPPHSVGGLSLHQCSVCFALVVEDFMPEHEDWHARILSPAREDSE